MTDEKAIELIAEALSIDDKRAFPMPFYRGRARVVWHEMKTIGLEDNALGDFLRAPLLTDDEKRQRIAEGLERMCDSYTRTWEPIFAQHDGLK